MISVVKIPPLPPPLINKIKHRMEGITVHADSASVNLNFWVTPDDANLDPSSGGLVVYPKEPPSGGVSDDSLDSTVFHSTTQPALHWRFGLDRQRRAGWSGVSLWGGRWVLPVANVVVVPLHIWINKRNYPQHLLL